MNVKRSQIINHNYNCAALLSRVLVCSCCGVLTGFVCVVAQLRGVLGVDSALLHG